MAGRFHGICKREEARPGYTPVNASEWGGTQEFLADSLLPALRNAIGGTNVRATTARFYRATTTSWQTVVELTYKGKRWEGTESGHWVDSDHLLMTFRYAKGGYSRKKAGRRNPRSNVAWGDANKLHGANGRRGYESCKIGTATWDEFAERVRAIKEAGHTKPLKFTGSVIDIVVSFHLAHVAMVAKVDSQIARLSALDDSDDGAYCCIHLLQLLPLAAYCCIHLVQLLTLVATVDTGCIVSSLVMFSHSQGQIAHFGPPTPHALAKQADVLTFNKDTDPTLFRICCATCNDLHGVDSAVVVTANYLAEKNYCGPWWSCLQWVGFGKRRAGECHTR
jgi:hypothetical protein